MHCVCTTVIRCFQIPEILMEHEQFLKDLHKRLEIWDAHQRIGDILLEMVCYAPRTQYAIRIEQQHKYRFLVFRVLVFQKACDRLVHVVYKQLEASQGSYQINVQLKTSVLEIFRGMMRTRYIIYRYNPSG